MFRLLLGCALGALTLPPLSAQDSTDARPETARVEVVKGRAVLMSKDRSERTLGRNDTAVTEGRTHVEIGAGSEVRLQWPGRASLRIWGPASLQWDLDEEPEEAGRVPTSTFSDRGLVWKLFDVAWADVEIRRGNHTLYLPGDWRATLEQGAFHLRGLPSGPIELRHHAGSPVTLEWIGASVRPPLYVYAGSNLRLDRPAPARADASDGAKAWSRPEWPWRAPTDTADEATERAAERDRTRRPSPWPSGETATEEKGSVSDFDADPPVAVVRPKRRSRTDRFESREPDVVQRRPATPDTPGPAETRRNSKPEPETKEPAAAPRQERRGKDAWRGLSERDLNVAGPLSVQRATGVEVRVFASERRKVFVDATAAGPIWCFGPDKDYLFHPGAVGVFEADGSLRMKFGDVEEHDPVGKR